MKLYTILLLSIGLITQAANVLAAGCGDLDVKYNLFDVTNEELFHNGEGTPGPRRLVTDQTSNIISLSTKRIIQATEMDVDTLSIRFQKLSGSRIGGKTTLVVCSIDEDKRVTKHWEFSVKGGKRNIGDTWSRTVSGLAGRKLAVRLVGRSPTGSARFGINLIRPTGEGRRWQPVRSVHHSPVDGFADLHVHQAASLAYSGGWYWGDHFSPFLAHGGAACTGENHGDLSALGLHHIESFLGPHYGKIYGYPSFNDWPRWDDIKHQQVTHTWLKQAHERGLNLIVASLVNNQWLSAAMIASGKHNNSLSPADMESVKRQIVSLKKMSAENSWYQIVRDPWEARRAIEAGRLAVILAVEVSDLMSRSDGPWRQQLHDLYDMGVRSIQLAHESNSLFSGAAYHRDAFKYNSRIKAWFDRDIDYASGGNGKNNPLGLTAEGRQLLREMMRLDMLIDIAHLPLKTQREIYSLVARESNYYPIFNSHTRLEALLKAEDRAVLKEHVTTDEVLRYVRRTGGVLGLRTGEEAMLDYPQPGKGQAVANNCDGSSRSFAQFYQYADDRGVKLAFGSDFNGFITQMPPRFGSDACASAATSAERNAQALAQGRPDDNLPDYVKQFNEKGLAHIGLLPGLLADMQRLGVDTENISSSAEHVVRMWERIYDPHRTAIP